MRPILLLVSYASAMLIVFQPLLFLIHDALPSASSTTLSNLS